MITKRPGIPAPKEKSNLINIPGRDGSLVFTENAYEDIEIEVEMNFISDPKGWGNRYRVIKRWLLSKGTKLKFSDDEQVFYKVKKVIIDGLERAVRVGGAFRAIFICDPYTYLESGTAEYDVSAITTNAYSVAHPIYKVRGEGMCTITVNGKTMTANIGQNITINTDLMLAYRTDGTIQNTSVKGDYSDLYLQEGHNNISITPGFSLTIIPNWRCL